jgi:hypothetical protein
MEIFASLTALFGQVEKLDWMGKPAHIVHAARLKLRWV